MFKGYDVPPRLEDRLTPVARPHYVPTHLRLGLQRYVEDGTSTGDALRAILSNDLHGAMRYADHLTVMYLWGIVTWIHNEAPADCWGSPLKVHEWIKKHRRKDVSDGN